ncbi:MAG: ATP-binding protein [Anaerolineaceae bacterium]
MFFTTLPHPVHNFSTIGRHTKNNRAAGKLYSTQNTPEEVKGILVEDLPNIFDRFWRGDESRQAVSSLGLAIARQLVQAQGGSISVESQFNQGTTFIIDLHDGSPRPVGAIR